MANKKFSVLMSVYYKESPNSFNDSLNSVFNQTLMPNEVIIVKDGKLTKELDKVIEKYQKKYSKIIKVIAFKQNRGLGFALADGINACTNEIVIRSDTDDISKNNRFEKIMSVFSENQYSIVGSNIIEFDEKMENITSIKSVPETHDEILKYAKKRNPFNHMSVAFRKEDVLKAGNYMDMPYFEDYFLWCRVLQNGGKCYNIQEHLVDVRGGTSMIKRRGGFKYIKCIINFEKAILQLGFINKIEFINNLIIRILICILPTFFRKGIYLKFLRKEVNNEKDNNI